MNKRGTYFIFWLRKVTRIALRLGYKYEIEYEYDFSCHDRLPHRYNILVLES